MNLMRFTYLVILFTCLHLACRERYGLPIEKSLNNSLVVEGNILKGDSTVIRLSRTGTTGERKISPETGAAVIVEGEDNISTTLLEMEAGVYKVAPIDLIGSVRYRLKISTSGKEYESDWLTLINTSEIDTLFWERNDGVRIFAKSSGNADNNRYYKWDYEEVWDFYSKYKSYAYFTSSGVDQYGRPNIQCIEKVIDGVAYPTCIEAYDPSGIVYNDSMYHCWKYQNSHNIIIGSTAALSENVMLAPIRKIDENSFELTSLYSILVKQSGLSKEAYDFYRILKGNTEGVGSIFDAQPSQLKTNLRCLSDPGEIIIGYIDATSVKTKRLFISNSEVGEWHYDPFACKDTSYGNNAVDVADAVTFAQVPVNILEIEPSDPFRISTYSTSGKFCVDCRLRGVHRQPDFWP